jgi:hypothetical protein
VYCIATAGIIDFVDECYGVHVIPGKNIHDFSVYLVTGIFIGHACYLEKVSREKPALFTALEFLR